MNSIQASREKRNEFMGLGAGIQAAGVAIFLLSLLSNMALFGFLIMVGMLIWGSQRSAVWLCSHCRNKLGSQEVRVCPSCRAELS